MDYERALEILHRAVGGTESEADFQILEVRLRENLRDERVFGPTPERSSRRYEILPGLDQISRRLLGCSFNDLLLGRFSGAGLAAPRVNRLLGEKIEARPTPEDVPLPVQPRLHVLPFDKLAWEQFEYLCAALVAAQANVEVLDCHLYGRRGEDQKGIDIVATQQGKERAETWIYQCKRYESYTAGLLKKALEKISYPADYTVVLLGCEAGTALREEVKHRANTFLWDAIDISRKLKNHPQLVQDFFGVEWRKAFNP